MSSTVDQVANVVLYSNDSYIKCVAIEETGYIVHNIQMLVSSARGFNIYARLYCVLQTWASYSQC